MRKSLILSLVSFLIVFSLCISGCDQNGLYSSPGGNLNIFSQPPITKCMSLADKTITVQANSYYRQQFSIFSVMQNTQVISSFYASGGAGNDIRLLILDSTAFVNWSNGHSVSSYYDSGKLTTLSFNLNLPTGTYYLVLDNTFSIISSKQVKVQVGLEWQEYQ
ncbi:hypothetical protein Dm11a5_1366 [Dehalococcoides mccartyi]|uniref:GOLD domain-containing protein n=2 Tax=Dehalococcoides mccartyi TaxID=61435 RepID=A0A142VBR1_9CHLR|nr:hypothetical protein Dm11a5_1366 [Dehalococcoides mccartyi]